MKVAPIIWHILPLRRKIMRIVSVRRKIVRVFSVTEATVLVRRALIAHAEAV